jgi:hypothetical protein
MTDYERHSFDVVVIGAGGAGLRAAIEARLMGKRVAIVCKSLFGKAHTVMAEGGMRRRDGQRQQPRQLAGALPRHHARRQVPQQLADGRAARQGGARPRVGARDLRRAVRPHQGRAISQRNFGGHLPATRPRRRPHRPRDHPHPAAEDRLAAAGGLPRHRRLRGEHQGVRRGHDHPLLRPGSHRSRAASPAPSATTARPATSCRSRRPRSCSPPAASARRSRSRATRGSTPATATPWPARRRYH